MKQHRLVIIDDEQIVIEGIRAIIKREELPCDVVGSAGDGIEGRNVIREKEPDLVITDIRIPGIDGLSLIEEMREFLPDTCFIVISGYTEFQYAQKALKLGVLDYIDKPVTIAKLKEAIRRVDEGRIAECRFLAPAGRKGGGHIRGNICGNRCIRREPPVHRRTVPERERLRRMS
jgi:YesN/AraC family two-component response regulator